MKKNEPKIWPEKKKQYDGWLFFVFAFVRCISLLTMQPLKFDEAPWLRLLVLWEIVWSPRFPTTTEIKPWYDPRKTIVEWFFRRKKPWVLRIGRAIFVTTTFVGILEPFFPQRYCIKTCKDHIRVFALWAFFATKPAGQTNKQTNKQTTFLPQLPPPHRFPTDFPLEVEFYLFWFDPRDGAVFQVISFRIATWVRWLCCQNHQLGAYLTHIINEVTPWKMNGWNLQPSPMKRKENDLNQTSRELCSSR